MPQRHSPKELAETILVPHRQAFVVEAGHHNRKEMEKDRLGDTVNSVSSQTEVERRARLRYLSGPPSGSKHPIRITACTLCNGSL